MTGLARRILQVALGAVLFLWALGWLDTLRVQRVPYAVLTGLLLAGSMWVSESVVACLAALVVKTEKNTNAKAKGPRE